MFENSTGDDDVAIVASGGGNTVIDVVGGGGSNTLQTFDLMSSGLSGSSFTFQVTNNAGNKPGVRIRSISVEAIPLPPAVLGVVSAFAMAFGLKRATRRA